MKTMHLGRGRRGERGFSLIELLMALAMLTVGMAGIAVMVVSSMYTNFNNKQDTTATMLSQLVMSQITSQTANGTSPTITDCKPQTWTLNTAVGGATLYDTTAPSPFQAGDVNWSDSYTTLAASNYAMRYQTCSGATYEVRWNVNTLTTLSNQVSVAARLQQAASGNANLAQLQYGTPVTLRSIVGN